MGRDKALLKLNRQTFIGHLAQELSGCREVFISSCIERDYSAAGLQVLVDERKDVGPMEGIRQALRHASTNHVFVCAVDMPFIRRDMVEYLANRISSEDDACVFRDGERIHPLCGIYSSTALPFMERLMAAERHRMMELLSLMQTKYVDISSAGFARRMLSNINTPEDYDGLTRAFRRNGSQ
jgi:molybdopterin-guanine dinucleotide biosynthesis protein A